MSIKLNGNQIAGAPGLATTNKAGIARMASDEEIKQGTNNTAFVTPKQLSSYCGGLELCDIGMALYVDETKGKRRYLNGSTMFIYECYEPFLKRLQEIIALYPNLSTTEENWQAEALLSAHGQVGKFVISESTYYGFASGESVVYTDSIEDGRVKVYTPDFVLLGEGIITSENLAYNLTYTRNNNDKTMTKVRLPKVVNVQGLFDLQNLGMTVGAGLPNITGHLDVNADRNIFNGGQWGAFYRDRSGGKTWAALEPNTPNSLGDIHFNASRSNPIYGNSNTVQQEAIQYPYFIQIATGQETEANIINEIELNNPYSLFDSKYSDHELNNLSWLKSEGQWNAKAVYPDAYNELLTEYNNSASSEEIEGSITFKRTPKGYKIALADQETAIDTKYSKDGIAWYYILDTTNEKFKLPRTKFGFEGLRTSVGDDIAESLPNIKGGVKNDVGEGDYGGYTGAISLIAKRNNPIWQGATNVNRQRDWDFNASRSSSTYKDGAPVQERATQMYLYFYVGETVQNANLIDAGRIGEQLANHIAQPHIVETYRNGQSWYRVWSDGWCEQGGVLTSVVNSINTNINLLKSYKDLNFNANAWCRHLHFGAPSTISCKPTNTNYIQVCNSNTSSADMIIGWETKGFIA